MEVCASFGSQPTQKARGPWPSMDSTSVAAIRNSKRQTADSKQQTHLAFLFRVFVFVRVIRGSFFWFRLKIIHESHENTRCIASFKPPLNTPRSTRKGLT